MDKDHGDSAAAAPTTSHKTSSTVSGATNSAVARRDHRAQGHDRQNIINAAATTTKAPKHQPTSSLASSEMVLSPAAENSEERKVGRKRRRTATTSSAAEASHEHDGSHDSQSCDNEDQYAEDEQRSGAGGGGSRPHAKTTGLSSSFEEDEEEHDHHDRGHVLRASAGSSHQHEDEQKEGEAGDDDGDTIRPGKKRKPQKRRAARDLSGAELEMKRLSNRLSSRRSQERKRQQLVYLQTRKDELDAENHQLRQDNQQLKEAIRKFREGGAGDRQQEEGHTTAPAAAAAAVASPLATLSSDVPATTASTSSQSDDRNRPAAVDTRHPGREIQPNPSFSLNMPLPQLVESRMPGSFLSGSPMPGGSIGPSDARSEGNAVAPSPSTSAAPDHISSSLPEGSRNVADLMRVLTNARNNDASAGPSAIMDQTIAQQLSSLHRDIRPQASSPHLLLQQSLSSSRDGIRGELPSSSTASNGGGLLATTGLLGTNLSDVVGGGAQGGIQRALQQERLLDAILMRRSSHQEQHLSTTATLSPTQQERRQLLLLQQQQQQQQKQQLQMRLQLQLQLLRGQQSSSPVAAPNPLEEMVTANRAILSNLHHHHAAQSLRSLTPVPPAATIPPHVTRAEEMAAQLLQQGARPRNNNDIGSAAFLNRILGTQMGETGGLPQAAFQLLAAQQQQQQEERTKQQLREALQRQQHQQQHRQQQQQEEWLLALHRHQHLLSLSNQQELGGGIGNQKDDSNNILAAASQRMLNQQRLSGAAAAGREWDILGRLGQHAILPSSSSTPSSMLFNNSGAASRIATESPLSAGLMISPGLVTTAAPPPSTAYASAEERMPQHDHGGAQSLNSELGRRNKIDAKLPSSKPGPATTRSSILPFFSAAGGDHAQPQGFEPNTTSISLAQHDRSPDRNSTESILPRERGGDGRKDHASIQPQEPNLRAGDINTTPKLEALLDSRKKPAKRTLLSSNGHGPETGTGGDDDMGMFVPRQRGNAERKLQEPSADEEKQQRPLHPDHDHQNSAIQKKAKGFEKKP